MNKALTEMAKTWYGYGNWKAPYWFVGPEPGMAKDCDTDTLQFRCEAWSRLGGGSLLDCAAHHRAFGFFEWHIPHPPTQPTWRRLIGLLLASKGEASDIESVRSYQRDRWGNEGGETCVVELSSLAARNLQEKRDRETYREERIDFLRYAIQSHNPLFVVFYGGSQLHWESIAGKALKHDGLVASGNTVFMLAKHPVKPGLTNSYWNELEKQMRSYIVRNRRIQSSRVR